MIVNTVENFKNPFPRHDLVPLQDLADHSSALTERQTHFCHGIRLALRANGGVRRVSVAGDAVGGVGAAGARWAISFLNDKPLAATPSPEREGSGNWTQPILIHQR